MKKFKVEIHKWPKCYIIEEETEEKAKEKAKQRFEDQCDESIYEIIVK